MSNNAELKEKNLQKKARIDAIRKQKEVGFNVYSRGKHRLRIQYMYRRQKYLAVDKIRMSASPHQLSLVCYM